MRFISRDRETGKGIRARRRKISYRQLIAITLSIQTSPMLSVPNLVNLQEYTVASFLMPVTVHPLNIHIDGGCTSVFTF